MLKLYKWSMDYGRAGSLDGLFALDEIEQAELQKLIADKTEIYFGEVLGKHSEVVASLDAEDFTEVPLEHDAILALIGAVRSSCISGMCPLDFAEDADA
jgi:hypothetical protein